MRVLVHHLLIGLVATLLYPAPAQAESTREPGKDRLFAVVIGNNDAENTGLAPLHYADDDAVENALLLSQYHAEVILLTELDSESRLLYPGLTPPPPTPEAVQHAFDATNVRMAQARAEGLRPILYVFYSGHGDAENNHRGYVHLKGGRLWREQLLGLLAASKAFANHLIIDACKSYHMVFGRGAGGDRRAVVGALELEDQPLPANTGLMLSASGNGESHEWEAVQGGIFSHEVRSSLRGAADLDEDGVISYKEAASFAWTANSSISNSRFRPSFFVMQPRDPKVARAGLVRLAAAFDGDVLFFGPGASDHYYIERATGARILDFHPNPNQRLALLIPSERPLFLRQSADQREAALPATKRISMEDVAWQRRQDAARGAEHLAFTQLFQRPFDPQAVAAYREESLANQQESSPKPVAPWWRYGIGIAAPVLAGVGVSMTLLAHHEQLNATGSTSGLHVAQINDRTHTYHQLASGFYISAGVALATYAVWTLCFNPKDPVYVRSNLFGQDLLAPVAH